VKSHFLITRSVHHARWVLPPPSHVAWHLCSWLWDILSKSQADSCNSERLLLESYSARQPEPIHAWLFCRSYVYLGTAGGQPISNINAFGGYILIALSVYHAASTKEMVIGHPPYSPWPSPNRAENDTVLDHATWILGVAIQLHRAYIGMIMALMCCYGFHSRCSFLCWSELMQHVQKIFETRQESENKIFNYTADSASMARVWYVLESYQPTLHSLLSWEHQIPTIEKNCWISTGSLQG
jgi:hypothetical protein